VQNDISIVKIGSSKAIAA